MTDQELVLEPSIPIPTSDYVKFIKFIACEYVVAPIKKEIWKKKKKIREREKEKRIKRPGLY